MTIIGGEIYKIPKDGIGIRDTAKGIFSVGNVLGILVLTLIPYFSAPYIYDSFFTAIEYGVVAWGFIRFLWFALEGFAERINDIF